MKEVINYLKYLSKDGEPLSKTTGICYNLQEKFGYSYFETRLMWEGYPCADNFNPVGDGDTYPRLSRWDRRTKFGRKRREVCAYMADNLEKGRVKC